MTETILVTGANGEIGHGLIPELVKKNKTVITLDLKKPDPVLQKYTSATFVGSITDKKLLKKIFSKNNIDVIFHLAAVLSTGAEKEPYKAHDVNVNGTANLLEIANNYAVKKNKTVKFIFPSSIAVYGLPNLKTKQKAGKIKEDRFLQPITIYGASKLYCEMLGTYFSQYYKLLDNSDRNIDFRCVRFPGIISATTIPTGGTSDYAPEMLHSAAQGKGYESFVWADTAIPFMVMPDAVKALLLLNKADKNTLSRHVYNVSSFSATAEELAKIINQAFPDSAVSYKPDKNRQMIVDSWPVDIDDSKARSDWGWQPDHDINKAFSNYLIPEIRNKYNNET